MKQESAVEIHEEKKVADRPVEAAKLPQDRGRDWGVELDHSIGFSGRISSGLHLMAASDSNFVFVHAAGANLGKP